MSGSYSSDNVKNEWAVCKVLLKWLILVILQVHFKFALFYAWFIIQLNNFTLTFFQESSILVYLWNTFIQKLKMFASQNLENFTKSFHN